MVLVVADIAMHYAAIRSFATEVAPRLCQPAASTARNLRRRMPLRGTDCESYKYAMP